MAETKRCPMCGEEILAVAKKCRFCGEYLESKEKKPVKKSSVVAAVLSSIVILAVAIIACVSLSENGSAALQAVLIFIGLVVVSIVVFVISKVCDIAKNTSKHE